MGCRRGERSHKFGANRTENCRYHNGLAPSREWRWRTAVECPAVVRSVRAEDNGFKARTGFCPFHVGDAEDSIAARFRAMAAYRGNAVALVDGDAKYSYSQLLDRGEGY